jgi:hypothetical protein
MFIPVAITNGIVREKTYKNLFGDLHAHQISTVIASAAYITLAYFMLRTAVSKLGYGQLLLIGLIWLIMTVCFEFGFGHYVDKAPWSKLFADYNIFKGHVWGIFLIIVLLSPIIVKILNET